MNKLFNFVDATFYINLKDREDKNNILLDHFNEMGIAEYVKRIDGVYPNELGYELNKDGKYPPEAYAHGCTKAQINIIKYAKENNLNNVLYFEDDAKFYLDGGYNPLETIQVAIDNLKKIDSWEILHLGTNPGGRDGKFDLVAPNLIKITESIANHAVLVNSTIFDRILSDYDNGYATHLDVYYSNGFKEKFSVFPLCVTQRCGVVNDMGPNNYGGLCEQFWLDMYNKEINKLY